MRGSAAALLPSFVVRPEGLLSAACRVAADGGANLPGEQPAAAQPARNVREDTRSMADVSLASATSCCAYMCACSWWWPQIPVQRQQRRGQASARRRQQAAPRVAAGRTAVCSACPLTLPRESPALRGVDHGVSPGLLRHAWQGRSYSQWSGRCMSRSTKTSNRKQEHHHQAVYHHNTKLWVLLHTGVGCGAIAPSGKFSRFGPETLLVGFIFPVSNIGRCG